MKSVISKFNQMLSEGSDNDKIDIIKDIIIHSINEVIKEESFYSLPTNEILSIVKQSNIEDVPMIIELVSKMNENKDKDAILLLNVIESSEATFEECINIISKFKCSQICNRIGELSRCNGVLPEIDYPHIIKESRNDIDSMKKEIKDMKKAIGFLTKRISREKPEDFEIDIIKATRKGKSSNVQYLIEEWHISPETEDERKNTLINIASSEGHTEIVKYLCETCHVNVETKDKYEDTPISKASQNGHLEVVKCLYEIGHANVNVSNKHKLTPLQNAYQNGHTEVFIYLYETCHAKVTTELCDKLGKTPNKSSKTKEIDNYLRSIKHGSRVNFGGIWLF